MMMFQLTEVLATFAETVISQLIIARTVNGGNAKWKKSITAAALVTMVIWLLNQFRLFSVITSVVAVLGYTISVWAVYKGKIEDILLVAVDCMILIYILDFTIISIMGVVFQEEQMAAILTHSFSFMRMLFLILSKGMYAVLYLIFRNYVLTPVHFMSRKIWITVSIGIVLVYFFVENTLSNANIGSVFIWILLLALVVIGTYSFMQYVLLVKEKMRKEMAEEGSQQIRENYESLIQHYQDKQLFFHDLKNHYIVAGSYLKRNEYEKAKRYMEELEVLYSDEPVYKWTGIESLDILIQCKRRRAESEGILVEIFSDPIQWNFEEHEMINLVGNALDNAIDACRELADSERWIRITIRNVYDMMFIKVSNSCRQKPKVANGKFMTSKKEKDLHGFGMTSMKLIVDKHKGVMNTDYRDGIFTLVISFYNKEQEE